MHGRGNQQSDDNSEGRIRVRRAEAVGLIIVVVVVLLVIILRGNINWSAR
jgi:hypothetical protein